MEKGLLMLTLSIGCVWLLLDDFYGSKRLTSLVLSITPDVKSPMEKVEEKVEGYKEKVDKNTDDYLNKEGTLFDRFKEQTKFPYYGGGMY